MRTAPHVDKNATYPFSIRRVNEALGAEIDGPNLSQPINAAMKDAIYKALLEHHVLVFRDLSLSKEQQGRFAQNYGELESHVGRLRNGERYPVINDITNKTPDGKLIPSLVNRGPNHWHTDKSYHAKPSAITMLHGKEVPSKGGETLFVNMRLALEKLSPEMKARIDGLTAVHSWEANRINVGETPATEEQKRERPPVTHPLDRAELRFIRPRTHRRHREVFRPPRLSHRRQYAYRSGKQLAAWDIRGARPFRAESARAPG